MPRRSTKKTQPKKQTEKPPENSIEDEELPSDTSDYDSVSTNPEITNYNLDLTKDRRMNNKNVQQVNQLHSNGSQSNDNANRDTSSDEPNEPAAPRLPRTTTHIVKSGHKRKNTAPKKRKNHVLKEIKIMQNYTGNLMPKAPFFRLVREILMQHSQDFRISREALTCLQESSEMYLTQLFTDANYCTIHRNRVTLSVKDIELTLLLRGPLDPGTV